MAQLLIIFGGVPEYKELESETFVVSEVEWERVNNYSFRKPVIQLPNFKIPMDIRVILRACKIVERLTVPVNYLNSRQVVTVIREFIGSQRSSLDEVYY